MRSRIVVPILFTFVVIAVAAAIVLDLIYHWTAYPHRIGTLTQAQIVGLQKTLWDWLDLLLVPLVLAGGGLWFSRQERRSERAIAERRAEEAALEAYLKQMTTLLLEKSLIDATPEDPVRDVARAWTLTVLRRVSGERKGVLLRFLQESSLITAKNPIVMLADANLTSANLTDANLTDANLTDANLTDANLRGAKLVRARLTSAIMLDAKLENALLRAAKLTSAKLTSAKLTNADLLGADLTDANLRGANLRGANLILAKLNSADLRGADLTSADLTSADLTFAKLNRAKLTAAKLTTAKLNSADLRGAAYSSQTVWPENFNLEEAGVEEAR